MRLKATLENRSPGIHATLATTGTMSATMASTRSESKIVDDEGAYLISSDDKYLILPSPGVLKLTCTMEVY